MTFYHDTIEPLDYGLFFLPVDARPRTEAAANAHGLKPGQKVWYYPRRGFDLWNTRYFIVPGRLIWDSPARGYASFIPQFDLPLSRPGSFDGPDGPARRARWGATEDFRDPPQRGRVPRAPGSCTGPISCRRSAGRGVADRAATDAGNPLPGRTSSGEMPGVPVRDPQRVAWVETDRPGEVDRFLSRAEPDPSETVTVTRDEPQRVELTAVLRSPGLVVVSDIVLSRLDADRRRPPRRDPPDQPGNARIGPHRRNAPAGLPLRTPVVPARDRPFGRRPRGPRGADCLGVPGAARPCRTRIGPSRSSGGSLKRTNRV